MLTPGTARHLRTASAGGIFSVLAIDHRGNLLRELQKTQPDADGADVIALKRAVLAALLPEATAALIDPDYGVPALTEAEAAGDLPTRGLLAPLEVTDYDRKTQTMIAGWSVAKIKAAGFSGAKLLLYFHPDAPDAQAKTDLVERTAFQCRIYDLPLFLEPVVQPPHADAHWSADERTDAVIATARHFAGRGATVLKLEYPVSASDDELSARAALRELDKACASTPWTLLSAGVPFETFLTQAALACVGGAAGVIAGRAIWADAIPLRGAERDDWLRTVGAGAHGAADRLVPRIGTAVYRTPFSANPH